MTRSQTQRITVLGDGGMGTVCAIMLAENGHNVTIWSAFEDQAATMAADRENKKFLPGCAFPETLSVTADPAEAFDGVDWVMSAIPTQFLRGVWERLAPHYNGAPICSITKGVELSTLMPPTQILHDVLGDSPLLAVLSGPSIAPEIGRKLPAYVVVACEDLSFAETVQHCIVRPYFRVYTNDDITGVELAGALKNIIALAAGMIDGLKLGDNTKAGLLTRGLVEITRLGVHLGAKPETFYGLAGVGDLVTTCTSPEGRNRSFGQLLGEGKTADEALAATNAVVEGVPTTQSVTALGKKLGIELPVIETLNAILFEGLCPWDALEMLMNRPPRSEANSTSDDD
ncbi:MAG: NAD(P)-dependent glycerol-3-phosphate dehydrogenase [Phycisphaerales bacterium]|jgi:glycerol-3-phosphate dehydrogenase (NAD(P)+)|nr:NAD(P)-dependent glycerol-3-phosphate dehydrogenase [Phycisphaerales bacterium]MBT7171627.1 NAD(P)-dependent glycerol-3-phosphate dehydrogenase [Phycisphaerales bacterium]